MHLWKISVNNQYTLIEQSAYDRDYDPTICRGEANMPA